MGNRALPHSAGLWARWRKINPVAWDFDMRSVESSTYIRHIVVYFHALNLPRRVIRIIPGGWLRKGTHFLQYLRSFLHRHKNAYV